MLYRDEIAIYRVLASVIVKRDLYTFCFPAGRQTALDTRPLFG